MGDGIAENNQATVVSLEEHKRKKKVKRKSRPGVKGLLRGYDGMPKPTLGNAVLILQNEDVWEGVFSFDLHAGRVRKEKVLPAGPHDMPSEACEATPFLEDHDIDLVTLWIERKYKIAIPTQIIFKAVAAVARSAARDPIRDYCESLKWDGKKRLDKWLSTYVAVTDTPYVRAVGAKWMISAVARVYEAGAQVDHVLIIEGEQRGGKSSALRALCPNGDWFLSTTVDIGNKDAYQVISAKWLVEFAELGSMSKSVESKVKAFITDRVDTYRRAYAHLEIDQKRRCVFVGSVNPGAGQGYLKDATGGGRWWPVWSHSDIRNRLDVSKIERDRDQLWAEAVVRFKKGEPWHLVDPELIELAEKEHEDRREAHPWQEAISRYLTRPGVYEEGVTVNEVLENVLHRAPGDSGAPSARGDSMTVADILSALRWRKGSKPRVNGGTGRESRRWKYEPTEFAAKPRKASGAT